MSAERLTEAARVLRERAEAATPGPWEGYYDDSARPYWGVITLHTGDPVASHDDTGGYEEAHGSEGADATYIATMHPGVGLTLADWLDTAGADLWAHGPLCECGSGCTVCDDDVWQPHVRRALVVADLILGDAP